jgi:uncharacterized protein (TIGR02996 family)
MPELGDGERLLREIREKPDDDAPRIVYADWLLSSSTDPDEHARAELIHTQCGLDRVHPTDVPARLQRSAALLKKHKRFWVEPLRQANIIGNWEFRRGFLDAGKLRARQFVDVAPKLFELAPMLRALTFPEASNELVALAASPYFARLDDVVLHQMCSCGKCNIHLELPALFGSEHASNLRRLVLSSCRIEPDNAGLLFASKQLANVRVLDLHDNRITADGLATLVERPHTYTRLILAGNPLGDAGAIALAKATELSVEELDLSECTIDQAGSRALADAAWGDGVVKLTLTGNPIGKGPSRVALRERYGNRLEL